MENEFKDYREKESKKVNVLLYIVLGVLVLTGIIIWNSDITLSTLSSDSTQTTPERSNFKEGNLNSPRLQSSFTNNASFDGKGEN